MSKAVKKCNNCNHEVVPDDKGACPDCGNEHDFRTVVVNSETMELAESKLAKVKVITHSRIEQVRKHPWKIFLAVGLFITSSIVAQIDDPIQLHLSIILDIVPLIPSLHSTTGM